MSDQSPGERVLSGFLKVILEQHFNRAERIEAAMAVRSGAIVECVLKYLDYEVVQSSPSKVESQKDVSSETTSARYIRIPAKIEKQMDNLPVDKVFELVRKKKISKCDVLEIINRLEPMSSEETDNLSLREALRAFREKTTDVQWQTFYKIVGGSITVDPYVTSILKHR